MNLLALRTLIRKETGRYDLVTAAFADNGIDFHINAGQRYLDRLMDNSNSIGRRIIDVTAGNFLVTFEDVRSILEVWCSGQNASGDYKRLPIEKVELTANGLLGIDKRTLVENYTSIIGDIESGWPLYYSPADLRLQTDRNGSTGGIGGFMDVLSDGFQTYNGIVLRPPVDKSYSIEIVGNFYSMTLTDDDDSTFWSDRHPDILLMAVNRQLEIMQRNRAGVEDWTAAIKDAVSGIDMDAAKQESADISEMNG